MAFYAQITRAKNVHLIGKYYVAFCFITLKRYEINQFYFLYLVEYLLYVTHVEFHYSSNITMAIAAISKCAQVCTSFVYKNCTRIAQELHKYIPWAVRG